MIRLALIILLLSNVHAEMWKGEAPGGFSAQIQISGNEFSIQDPIHIDVVLTYPSGYAFNQGALRSNLLRNPSSLPSAFALSQETALIEEKNATLQYILEPQMPGDFTLTLYDIGFFPKSNPEDKKTVIFSSLFPVKILPDQHPHLVMEESAPFLTLSRHLPVNLNNKNRNLIAELTQNEPEYNVAIEENRSFPWGILGALLAAALGYGFYRFQKPESRKEKRLLNARSKALYRLDKVKGERSDTIYGELSNTVRFYIEERYEVHAPRKTTQEFLVMLPSAPLPENFPKDELKKFLLLSDKVKFAKGHTTQDEREQAWDAAKQFIES